MIVISQMKQQSRKPVGEDPILPTGYIQVFDSVYDGITSDTVNQICSIVWSQKSITIEIMDVLKAMRLCRLWPFCIGSQHIMMYWRTTIRKKI